MVKRISLNCPAIDDMRRKIWRLAGVMGSSLVFGVPRVVLLATGSVLVAAGNANTENGTSSWRSVG